MHTQATIPTGENQVFWKCENKELHGEEIYYAYKFTRCQAQGCGKNLVQVRITKQKDGNVTEEPSS